MQKFTNEREALAFWRHPANARRPLIARRTADGILIGENVEFIKEPRW